MNHQHQNERPELRFEKMDATNMNYNDDDFNVILDKGTLGKCTIYLYFQNL